MKWIDLSMYGLNMCPRQLRSGRVALIICGPESAHATPHASKLSSLKFKPFPQEGIWFSMAYSRPDGSIGGIKASEFKQHFPDLEIKEMSAAHLASIMEAFIESRRDELATHTDHAVSASSNIEASKVQAPSSSRQFKTISELDNHLVQQTSLGHNHLNEEVFDSVNGRFIQADGLLIYETMDDLDSPRFLRALKNGSPSLSKIDLCVLGIARSAMSGENISLNDIEALAKTVLKGQVTEYNNAVPEALLMNAFKKSLSHAIQTSLYETYSVNGLDSSLISKAADIYTRLPSDFLSDQHPVVSILAGKFISNGHQNISLYSGNGTNYQLTLAGVDVASRSVKILSYDEDLAEQSKAHSTQVIGENGKFITIPESQINKSVAFTNDFVSGHFDGVITDDSYNGVVISNTSHIKLLAALNTLREGAVGVVSFDDHKNDATGNTEANAQLLSEIYNKYRVIDIFDVSSFVMRGKPGSATRFLIIAGRQNANTPHHQIPKSVAVISSIDALVNRISIAQMKIYDPDAAMLLNDDVDASIASAITKLKPINDDIVINAYQAKYITLSSKGTATSLIPINLQYPQQIAFMKYSADPINLIKKVDGHGVERSAVLTIEEILAQKLKYSVSEINQYFEPEQKDGIAIAIWRHENGKSFVIGDAAGVGKGRQLAAIARYFNINGEKIIFSTKSAELLNDFWGDVRDINADKGPYALKPYLVNPDAQIQDDNGKILYSGDEKINAIHIEKNEFPKYANIILYSYTQINRYSSKILSERAEYDEFGHKQLNEKRKATPRIDWLINLSEQACLLCDESHEASGLSSNIGDNLRLMVESSKNTIYSSATFSANEKKLTLYRRVFPLSLDIDEMSKALTRGGEPLQEVMSANLVAEGAMMVRNHDLSSMHRKILVNPNKDEIRSINDIFASVMMGLNRLIKEVDIKRNTFNDSLLNAAQSKLNAAQNKIASQTKQIGNRINKRDLGIQSTGIGSILHLICRQFSLALNAEYSIQAIIDSARSGNKPIIYVEQTGETILKQLISNKYDIEDKDYISFENNIAFPEFKDVLNRMVDNTLSLTRVLPNGEKIKVSALELFTSKEDLKVFNDALLELRAMIEGFPSLPFSPLDTIRLKLNQAGISVGELSGRQYGVTQNEKGETIYFYRPDSLVGLKSGGTINATDKIATARAFNNGDIDAITITNAGATGISLHSSDQFKDQNPRDLFILEFPSSITGLIQVMGRAWRRNQVNKPNLNLVTNSIPAEYRTAAALNQNLAKLSAQTSANRENFAKMDNKYDLLNPIGDRVVHTYLESRPELIDKLGFTQSDLGEYGQKGQLKTSSVDSLSRRLSGRLIMLCTDDQQKIYDDLDVMYQSHLLELELMGQSPLKRTKHDWRAIELDREIVMGHEQDMYESEFLKPVYMTTIQFKQPVKIIRSDEISKLIDANHEVFKREFGSANYNQFKPLQSIVTKMEESFSDEIMRRFKYYAYAKRFSHNITNWDEALQHELLQKESSFTELYNNLKALKEVVSRLAPGSLFTLNGNEYIALKINQPSSDNLFNAAMWTVQYVTPGAEIESRSLEGLLNNAASFSLERFSGDHPLADDFDSIPDGQFTTENRIVLTGNMFLAADLCVKLRAGKACTYSDVTGAYHQAMLMPENFTIAKILEHPVKLKTADEMKSYLTANRSGLFGSDAAKIKTGEFSITLMPRKSQYHVTIPMKYLHDVNMEKIQPHIIAVPNLSTKKDHVFRIGCSQESLDALIEQVVHANIPVYTGENGMAWMRSYKKQTSNPSMKI